MALYTKTRQALEQASRKFEGTASEWGPTVSIEQTKGMATGYNLREEDVAPVQVVGGEIEMVEHFPYLGSVLSRDGNVMEDVKCRIAKASRMFGCLRGPIFNNPILSIPTKRAVYKATVLSVLLYGAETWALKAEHVRRLTTFHNRCVRTILGVTRYQQWQERLRSKALASRFSMEWSIPDIIMDRRLQWLGHLGHMENEIAKSDAVWGVEDEKTMPWDKEEMERSDVRRPASLKIERELVSAVSGQKEMVGKMS